MRREDFQEIETFWHIHHTLSPSQTDGKTKRLVGEPQTIAHV